MIFWLLAGPRDGARVGAMNEVAASAGWYPHTTYLYGVAGRSLSLKHRCSSSPAQYSIVVLVEEWVIYPDDSLE